MRRRHKTPNPFEPRSPDRTTPRHKLESQRPWSSAVAPPTLGGGLAVLSERETSRARDRDPTPISGRVRRQLMRDKDLKPRKALLLPLQAWAWAWITGCSAYRLLGEVILLDHEVV